MNLLTKKKKWVVPVSYCARSGATENFQYLSHCYTNACEVNHFVSTDLFISVRATPLGSFYLEAFTNELVSRQNNSVAKRHKEQIKYK